MEVPMVSERGAADVRALGVEPRSMAEVLGAQAASRLRLSSSCNSSWCAASLDLLVVATRAAR